MPGHVTRAFSIAIHFSLSVRMRENSTAFFFPFSCLASANARMPTGSTVKGEITVYWQIFAAFKAIVELADKDKSGAISW